MGSQLIVRDLEDWVVQRLKERAAQHSRSAEAEHREILKQALGARRGFKALLLAMPDVGRDEEFDSQRNTGRPIEL